MPIEFYKGDGVSNITVQDAHPPDGLILVGIQRGNDLLFHKITFEEACELMCVLFGMVSDEGDQMALKFAGRTMTVTKNVQPANNPLKWAYDVPPDSATFAPKAN